MLITGAAVGIGRATAIKFAKQGAKLILLDMENANLICFLASDESSYISGQNIQIDGCRKRISDELD